MVPKLSALVSLLLFSSALACTCLPPSIHRTYFDPSVVNFVKATVIDKGPDPTDAGLIKYTLWVRKNFKGCAPPSIVTVFTPESSAACGINLDLFKTYVLPISSGAKPQIILCDFIVEYSKLSAADKSFLDSRNVCCGSSCTCVNNNLVRCFRQPCSPPDPPCAEATKCVDNYCGGCFAEWFTDKGFPACK